MLETIEKVRSFFANDMTVGGFSIPYWAIAVAVAVLAALLITVICSVNKSHKKSEKKMSKRTEEIVNSNATRTAETAEIPVIQAQNKQITVDVKNASDSALLENSGIPKREKKEVIAEEVSVEEIPEETVAAEEVPAEEIPEETVAAEEVPAEEIPEETVAAEEVPAEEIPEETVAAEEVSAEEIPEETEAEETDEDGTDRKKRSGSIIIRNKWDRNKPVERKAIGKIEICNCRIGGYNYILRANNGQLLYESKSYKTVKSCQDGAKGFLEAVEANVFTVRSDKFGRYKFVLKSPSSNSLLYIGESFDNRKSCENNIESVRGFAVKDVPIEDMTEENYVADLTAYEISAETKEAVESGKGAVGKWVISKVYEDRKVSPFVFLLYANNGQLLYESCDYKTEISCQKGLETFRKAVKEGTFVIDPDKSGRYQFILRNNSSVKEYIGQNYATERACGDGIESIYRFALLSPVDF